METEAYQRIKQELCVHPKERKGFRRADFESLEGIERDEIIAVFLGKVENGFYGREQLEWLLGDEFLPILKARFAAKAPRAPVYVHLAATLFDLTGSHLYLRRVMEAILAPEGYTDRRAHSISILMRRIGTEQVFLDFCRHVLLHVPEQQIKTEAMRWFAAGCGYLTEGLQLTSELEECVEALVRTRGQHPAAIALVARMHPNSGRCWTSGV